MLLENVTIIWENTKSYNIQVNWASDSVLSEGEGRSNAVQRDTAPHVYIVAAVIMLHYGMWVVSAPDSAVISVCYTIQCGKQPHQSREFCRGSHLY